MRRPLRWPWDSERTTYTFAAGLIGEASKEVSSAQRWRKPARQQDPKQPIKTTQAGATSSAALQHCNLMAQRDRFQKQRGTAPEFAPADQDCPACRDRHEGRLSPGV
jgi:hypothetical protein